MGDLEHVFQSIARFEKLIRKICKAEGLTCRQISHLTAGTNAAIKAGRYVVKIFAPMESGLDSRSDFHSEVCGMKRAFSRYCLPASDRRLPD